MTHTLCPQCGHNFEADTPVDAKQWRIDPRSGRASWRRISLPLRTKWVEVLHTVAAAYPAIVTPDAVLNRISSSEDVNLVRVTISQMRRNWPANVPWPIETVYGYGYRWAA